MGYYFYFPPENKIVVARYAEFSEKSLITQEVSGRAIDLEEIQDEDTSPFEITSKISMEVEGFEPPQQEVILIHRSERIHQAPNRLCLNVEAEEHSLGDLHEPTSYKVAMLDPKSNKWLDAMNAEMQYMVDNKQMDVKTAFLNGYLDEDIYMVQHEGFVDPKHPRKVCKLQRSINGLKQASRSWNKRFDEEIKKFGFAQNLDEPCVYQKASESNVTFLILYFDDIIIMGNHIPSLQSVKDYLGKCFPMKDLREAAFILGIKIYKDRSKRLIRLSQNAYMDKILRDGGSTKDMFLVYGGNPKVELRVDCYCNAGFETDRDDIKSQIGYVFILNGGAVDWKSFKQSTTAMSATEVEYIVASEAAIQYSDAKTMFTAFETRFGVAIDGAGFDWSFMAEEEVTTNMTLMAFSDSKVYNDKTCSNTCLKSFETLKTQLDNLRVEFNKSEFTLATYKRGLTSVEEQLVFDKKNEVMFYDQIVVLKRDASFKDSKIIALESEIEKLKKEKECNQIKIDKFENASKCLDKLIGSQISDNSRKGMGYNAVPPLPTGLFAPPTIDLLNSGLEEFKQPKFKGYGPKASKSVYVDTSNEVKKTSDTLLVEELLSEKEKQTIFPKQQDKTARKAVKPKAVNTARLNSEVVNTIRDNQTNAVKASACWVWRPTKLDSAPITLKKHNYIDARGRSKSIMAWISRSLMEDMLPSEEELEEEKSLVKMCDRKNCVLFTDTACFVLSPDFKLLDKSQILLKIPRRNNMYSVDIKNIVPKESLTCLIAKATLDESMLCLMNKKYYLVVTDDYSRFTWVFFLASKDETSGILKNFITEIENLVDKKVKIIRCNNGTEFKNRVMNEFCEQKGIKREYSVARTPQQNGVAERRNRTLIEAARTMLADSKLPTTFWAEAVNTACYVQNRVIIVKPHNKTPYELFRGRTPALSFMRPFGCHVSILNTLDHLGKFDGKSDDGFFVGYSLTSKAFRVYNIRTRKVEENLHIRFLEDKPIVSGNGPKWLFDIDSLTKSMNYVPVIAGTNSNDFAGSEVSIGEGTTSKETDTSQDYIVMPLWKDSSLFDSPSMNVSHDEPEPSCDAEKKDDEGVSKASGVDDQERPESSTPNINTAGPSINTASATHTLTLYKSELHPSMKANKPEPSCDAKKKDDEGVSKESGVDDQERPESSTPNINTAGPSINTASANLRTSSLHINTVSPTVLTTRSNRPQSVSDMFSLRDNVTPEATNANLFSDETEIDMSNLNASYHVPTTPNTRIHKDHSFDHVIGDI
ncbi:ribonuclease H-like domain-containing protein [Tanacetum coccineum]